MARGTVRGARSLMRMPGRGYSSDLTRSGKEATAERPSETWKEDGLKAESRWGRQTCQGQGMKEGCEFGPNRGPDRARQRQSRSYERVGREQGQAGGTYRPPLTYPVLPELLHHSQAEDVRNLCVHGEAGGQNISVLERKSETAGSAVEAPVPLQDTHSSWANFRDTYLGGHRGRRTQNGAMESHPTPMEARGCGPFCEKLLLTRHTQSCFSWGGRVSKAGPEQSRWEEALLRRPLVRVSPRARRQGSPTGCGRCN